MGIVYLIQPAELVGTNRVKVGCSNKSDLSRVTKGYKKGTVSLCICSTEEPFELEKTLLNLFKERFELLAGNEYFIGDIDQMRKVFFQQMLAYNAVVEEIDDAAGSEEEESKEELNNGLQFNGELINSDGYKFVCTKCNKPFKSTKGYKQHTSKCNGLHPLQCPICRKWFASAVGKSKHKRNVKCCPPTEAN